MSETREHENEEKKKFENEEIYLWDGARSGRLGDNLIKTKARFPNI
jgi:hypothetical protein